MRASLQYISDLALHSLLQPLLSAYSTLQLQRTPCHSQILKDSVSCWHLPLHGMSSPTHSTRSSSNVTSFVELSSHFSPVPSPVSAQINYSFLDIYKENTKCRKDCWIFTISIYLCWEHRNVISQVLLWNSEFIWGRTRANQWLQYNGLNVWYRTFLEDRGTEFWRTRRTQESLFKLGKVMVSYLREGRW